MHDGWMDVERDEGDPGPHAGNSHASWAKSSVLRFRLTARLRACRIALAMFLLLSAAGAARGQVKLELSAGFENVYRPQEWNPLSVTIKGVSAPGAATLQVLVTSRAGSATYREEIRLQPGPHGQKHTLTYFHPGGGTVPTCVVQLLSGGRKLAEAKIEAAAPLSEQQPAIVALTQDRSGLGYLHRAELGYAHAAVRTRRSWFPRSFGGGARGSNPVRVLYPDPTTLPANGFAYAGVDLVVLGDLPPESLTDPQWRALTEWVRRGGTLVVSGGSDINRLRARPLADLLPVRSVAVRNVSALPALAERYEAPLKLTSLPILDSRPVGGAVTLCVQGETPLVSYRRYGTGVVVLTAFDLTAPDLRAWKGQPALWEELIQAGGRPPRVLDLLKNASYSPYSGQYRALADALSGITASDAPSFSFIGLFLMAYIVCLVPLNYFILRRRDRRELAWITAPLIILAFSGGAYGIGYSIKGGQLFLRFASVVEGTANDEAFTAYTVASIFSPRQTRYDVAATDPDALPAEVTLDAGSFGSAAGDMTVERGRGTTIKDARINMWDLRTFGIESSVDLGGAVSAVVLPEQEAWRVRITNNTRYPMTDCAVSQGGVTASLGDLDRGQTRETHFRPSPLPGGRIGPVAASVTGTGSPARIKRALAAVVIEGDGMAGPSPLLFTAWIHAPVTGISLANENPRMEGANLVAVHLNAPGRPDSPVARMSGPPVSRPDPFSGMGLGGGFGGMPGAQDAMAANRFNNMAYEYARQGRLDEALAAAKRANAYAPQDANILDTMGEMYQLRKEYAKAEAWYRRALQRQAGGGLAETHAKFGETLAALGKKQEAIGHLQTAARDPGQWGERARRQLAKLGVAAPPPTIPPTPTPGPQALQAPPLQSLPPIPATGKGKRRIIQPGPNGGRWVIDQEWDNSTLGKKSSTRSAWVPPGNPLPP